MSEHDDIQIESHMPKVWEQEESFNDILYDWMGRAPWIAISLGLHFVAYFILLAIPWDLFKSEPETVIESSIEAPPPPEEEEPEEPEEELEEEEEVEPVIQDMEVSDHAETDSNEDMEDPLGDPNDNANSPFDESNFNNIIGTGGGSGGKFGGRMGGRKNLSGRGGRAVAEAIENGLLWLKRHQSVDGYWNVDEYHTDHIDSGKADCNCADETPAIATQDVGITGLALLAFLGDGSSTRRGEFRDVVKRGIKWLGDQQDEDNGLIGEHVGHEFVYDHAIASLAMAENYYDSKNPFQKKQTQLAMNFIALARAPYGGWRYDVPSDGDTDTSITGWMIFALKAGDDAKLKINKEGYLAAAEWLDNVTDDATGRVGYTDRGSPSSRTNSNKDAFPNDQCEALTGVGLLTRVFLGQTPEEKPVMIQHGDLMLRMLPEWDKNKPGYIDMYYWYYGTYAMYQLGGEHWKKWKSAMEKAIIPNQLRDADGHKKGSWNPDGAWGYQGGRVYATATMVLTLEVFYRYSGLLGAR